MSHRFTLALALVPAARLLWGRANVWRWRGAFKITIDERGVDPHILAPLQLESRQALARLQHLRIPGVTPAVGAYVERDTNGLVEIETTPYLISIYLGHGLMPQRTADDLAGVWGCMLRSL